MKFNSRIKAIIVLSTIGVVALWAGFLVFAHPRLQESNIPAGTVLNAADAPTRLELGFNEGIDTKRSIVYVYKNGPNSVVDLGDVQVKEGKLSVGLKALTAGVYIVRWIAISPDDAGYSEGTFSFAVK
jgi:methionine-rich copper-binding protein CopC